MSLKNSLICSRTKILVPPELIVVFYFVFVLWLFFFVRNGVALFFHYICKNNKFNADYP